ncbi:hypothetical protein Tco_1196196, partial [Tanacetum coccineum]
ILNAGLFKGIRIDDSLTLSHLFYADDAVFIGKWDKANFTDIVQVLKCFFLASGLKINIHKSKLMGIGIAQEEVSVAANLIGCTTFTTPFNYLGVKVPKGVLNRMEAIRRRFFYDQDNNEKKLSRIGWQKILASKKKGGLGVSSFFAINRALLFKWIWRFSFSFFPLYALECNKQVSVAVKLSESSLTDSFRREPRGGRAALASL